MTGDAPSGSGSAAGATRADGGGESGSGGSGGTAAGAGNGGSTGAGSSAGEGGATTLGAQGTTDAFGDSSGAAENTGAGSMGAGTSGGGTTGDGDVGIGQHTDGGPGGGTAVAGTSGPVLMTSTTGLQLTGGDTAGGTTGGTTGGSGTTGGPVVCMGTQGTVQFSTATDVHDRNRPRGVDVADMDGDGNLDVIVAMNGEDQVWVYYTDAGGGPSLRSSLDLRGPPTKVWTTDLDGDGDRDIVTSLVQDFELGIRFGAGGRTFDPTLHVVPLTASPTGFAAAQLDGGGRPDFAVTMLQTARTEIYTASPQPRKWVLSDTEVVGAAPSDLQLEALTGGAPFLLTADRDAAQVSVRLSQGDGTFEPATEPTVTTKTQPYIIQLGELSGDSWTDLVVYSVPGLVTVYPGKPGGGFGPLLASRAVGEAEDMVLTDVDCDGDVDVVTGDRSSNPGAIDFLFNAGDGTFTHIESVPVGRQPHGFALADLDSDGALDLVVANEQDDEVTFQFGVP